MDDHKMSIDELLIRYDVDVDTGLTSTQVAKRQKEYGDNCLTPPKKIPEWKKLCRQLFGGFSLLLWGGAVLCFLAYSIDWWQHDGDVAKDNLILGIALLIVVVLSGTFSYSQVS
jgi:sodium/potassium-transporting ATPase subunit alpha